MQKVSLYQSTLMDPCPNLPDDGVRVTLDNDDNDMDDPTEIPYNASTEDETQDTNTNNNDKRSKSDIIYKILILL